MAYDELIRSDQDSDNDDEDETRISLNLKTFHSMCSLERLLQNFLENSRSLVFITSYIWTLSNNKRSITNMAERS